MKKVFKIIIITLLGVVVLLAVTPFLFKSQLQTLVKTEINKSINAKVDFSDIDLSFFSSFPKANLSINDIEITTFKPFKNENLASIKQISFTIPLKSVLALYKDAPVQVNSIAINEALIALKADKFGNVNYDISKTNNASTPGNSEETKSNLAINIQDYSISNSVFTYHDDVTNTTVHVTELNHSGKGLFSSQSTQMETKTQANVSFEIDSTTYLSNTGIKLDAIFDLDLDNNKYTFKDNKAYINQLPLHFDGFVQLQDTSQIIDLHFDNPESSFKNFLAVVPKSYAKNLDDVQTSGDFKIKGDVKGVISKNSIPKININIRSNNSAFKYPNLPKRVENIIINTSIVNTTGNVNDTYVDVKTLNFKIDEDVFRASAMIKNLSSNIAVNSKLNGTLNLGNISKAYPIELEKELSGILKANINSSFDMDALENSSYERIKNEGSLQLDDFIFSSDEIINPIHIAKATIHFKPGIVKLDAFDAKTGQSDFKATGQISNLLAFMFNDTTLKGNFNLTSNTFAVSDFMTKETATKSTEPTTTTSASALKIPAFLDCKISAKANTVLYDNLVLTNVNGDLSIKEQTATITNMESNLFDGKITMNGDVNTQTEVPSFKMSFDASKFDVSKSFKGLELLQVLAPIAGLLKGKLNTDITLSGELQNDFTPNLSTVSGSSNAELLAAALNSDVSNKITNELSSKLKFIDFDKIELNKVSTKLNFSEGKVSVKPFKLHYKDIPIAVVGSHGFDTSMSYNVVMDVPAKYLGSEVNQLIGKINDPKASNLTIPVTATIGGKFTAPTVTTDLKSAVTNLTSQLVEIEKQKLITKGKDKLGSVLGGLLGNSTAKDKATTNDSTKVDIKKEATNLINGLFKKKKKD